MSKDNFILSEKYRPKTVEDCILPKRLKQPFQEFVNKKEIPTLLLSGPPGTGKTTVARAMCEEVGCSYMLINSSDDNGVDVLRTKIKTYASTMSLTGGRKVIILDEADGLTPQAQDAFRGVIEEFSKNCTFIFTCNKKAKIMEAIHSRCIHVDFNLKGDEKKEMAFQFFKRLKTILTSENITYNNDVLLQIVLQFFPDYRKLLNQIQYLSQNGSIGPDALSKLSNLDDVKELFGFLKNKEYGEIRKWLSRNSDVDAATLFTKLYQSVMDNVQKMSIPQAIIILAKYQYQSAFVADQEINTLACLTELMMECEYA